MNILVNLLPGFFTEPALQPVWERLGRLGTVRRTSWNTPDEIRADLAWADVVLMWSWPVLDEALLEQAPKLRFLGKLDISQRGAKAALAKGIPVSVSRGGFSPAVAEFALGLVLNLLRQQSVYHGQMRASAEPWVKDFPGDIDPRERELTGARVGIVGFGGVGRRIGELLQPFRPELRVCDPYVSEDVLVKAGARRTLLPEMLANSDVVVLCAASNPGTRHLVGAAELALLPRHAVFVNVARAALVDTDALVARLQKGDLAAAVDVFDQEPLPAGHPLRTLPNAFLTPHRAGGLQSSVVRIIAWLVDDLEAHLAGRPRRYPLVEAMVPSLDA
jgi:phosphoglycerate dehydrogenase-like enzyme